MKIGKLDPAQIFDKRTENKENLVKELKIGKIKPGTVFQAEFGDQLRSPETSLKIGKLDIENMFEPSSGEIKPERRVGKLKIEVSIY